MTIPNPPEREPDDTPAFGIGKSDAGTADTVDDPERLTGGAWVSLALSLSFYLLMLAVGAKYDSDHHGRARPAAEPDRPPLSAPMAYAPAGASGPGSLLPAPFADAPGALLARAHACAAVAQWDCVIEATSGVIARRGNTPETRALLAQAMVNGGWVPGAASTVSQTDQTQDFRRVSATPPGAKRMTKHLRRHAVRAPLLRYATTTRSDFPSYLPDIYRH